MSLYDWSQAPAWAPYAAMDLDGTAYWYEHRPAICGSEWHAEQRSRAEEIDSVWEDSLEKRPDETAKANGTKADVAPVTRDEVREMIYEALKSHRSIYDMNIGGMQ